MKCWTRGPAAGVAALAIVLSSGCATTRGESRRPVARTAASSNAAATSGGVVPWRIPDLYPSTYRPLPSEPTLITHATLLTGTGERLEDASLLMRDGLIETVGGELRAPPGANVIDARGKWVTPGLIDVHSHLGVYASPGVDALSDGNEATDPVTAEVWAEHSVWPQDPQFPLALAGGVTSMQILPGSANLIGGRSVTLKNVPARTVQGMKFPGAPYGLKMACGENPKRVYGTKNRAPSTRMGNVAGYRTAWIKAASYKRKWEEFVRRTGRGIGSSAGAPGAAGDGGGAQGRGSEPPERDLKLDTLAGVLDGDILVHNHCYRADEMAVMIDLAKEFGYHIAAFHHAVEAYKVADLLAAEGVCAAMWADWWGFKVEAYDGVRENIPMVQRAGACAIVHSDSAQGIQRLNQEAAKAMAAAGRAGIPVAREDAIRWLTLNPAKAIGISDRTGSLEAGKMADVVIWSGDPFSVYTRAEKVFVDGALLFDKDNPDLQPRTDFEVGIPGRDGEPR